MRDKAVVLDTETTGFDPDKHRVIEIAIVDWSTASTILHTKLNPECFIPPEITKINGITDDDVIDAPLFGQVVEQIREAVESVDAVLGYNPYFDQTMIDGEVARLGRPKIKWPTLICAKRVWDAHEPRVERNLRNAYKRFVNGEGFADAHTALADTMATRDVLLEQIRQFNLEEKTWEQFDPQRARWWGPSFHVLFDDGQLTLNFGKHKGKPVHEIDDGFWRWVTEKDFPDHVLALALKMRELIPRCDKMEPDYFRRELFTWAKESKWREKRL